MRGNLSRSVVITGVGLWTGLGADRESTWGALREGRSALRRVELPGTDELSTVAGAPHFRSSCEGESGLTDPALSLLLGTTREAMGDAGLAPSDPGRPLPYDPERIATVVGLSKGCLRNLGRVASGVPGDPTEPESRFWPDRCWPNSGASLLASQYDLRGPCLSPVAACATGLIAALQAADLVRRGACDVALAGAADASLEPLVLGAFRNMGVLARVEDDPTRALRPWDRRRSGFLVGEGAAVLVLERADHARARGAVPYAEFAGGAFGSDAFHATNQNPDPTGLSELLRRAMANAALRPAEIDLVNVHGTATPSNDPLECQALRRALGEAAEGVSCTANKSQIGHLLGAAGAAELAITCLSVRDGFVPPTVNLDEPDPACDLDGTPHVGRQRPIRAALKMSIGFGGHVAAALLRRVEGPARHG